MPAARRWVLTLVGLAAVLALSPLLHVVHEPVQLEEAPGAAPPTGRAPPGPPFEPAVGGACPRRPFGASQQPLIAVTCATTSRSMFERYTDPAKARAEQSKANALAQREPSTETLSLFTVLLPSIVKTVECGYQYLVVIGFDVGDRYFDSWQHQYEVRSWLTTHVIEPTRTRGIEMSVTFVSCDNPVRKPGPVFTRITTEAFERHADYIYRVNDDTELVNRWTTPFIETLTAMGPPYGVVGPVVCNKGPGGNKILTHDFVHRTHMTIFNKEYYPREFVDWWMDSWVTRVYGTNRTAMLPAVAVAHRTQEHGRRYTVNMENRQLLDSLVRVGSAQILAHMRRHDFPLPAIQRFLGDSFDGSGVAKPIQYARCDDGPAAFGRLAAATTVSQPPRAKPKPTTGSIHPPRRKARPPASPFRAATVTSSNEKLPWSAGDTRA